MLNLCESVWLCNALHVSQLSQCQCLDVEGRAAGPGIEFATVQCWHISIGISSVSGTTLCSLRSLLLHVGCKTQCRTRDGRLLAVSFCGKSLNQHLPLYEYNPSVIFCLVNIQCRSFWSWYRASLKKGSARICLAPQSIATSVICPGNLTSQLFQLNLVPKV